MSTIYKEILKKYDLSFVKFLQKSDGGLSRSHLILSETPRGKKYCLKIFVIGDDYAYDRFVDEINNIRYIRSLLSSRYKKHITKIRWYSQKGKNPYFIYEYFDGVEIGHFINSYGIDTGHLNHKNFEVFMNFFIAMSRIKSYTVKRKWTADVAKEEIKAYSKVNINGIDNDLRGIIVSYLDSHIHVAFAKMCLSHRDLYPDNMLIIGNRFMLIDWEYLSEVPIGFTPAFLYLLFWRETFWKSRVYSYFYNETMRGPVNSGKNSQRRFYMSFRVCLVLLGWRMLYQLSDISDEANGSLADARKSIAYDIRMAISGEVVRPRNIKFMLGLDDIESVMEDYNLGKIVSHAFFYASHGNTVVKVVTESGKYIIRFYSQSRSKALIRNELEIIERASNVGIQTHRVMRTIYGSIFLKKNLYGKQRKIAVLTFLNGKRISKKWANEKSAINLGSELRNIHDNDITHGDFSKENVLFYKSKIKGIIDFEWGKKTKSIRLKNKDLARSIALWVVDIRKKSISDRRFINSFICGYYDFIPENRKYIRILERVISSIRSEKELYTTVFNVNGRGSRFDNGILNIQRMIDDLEKIN